MPKCCACDGWTVKFLDLGMNYLSDFVEPGESRGERYPLGLVLCENCGLIQLEEVVSRPVVHHEHYAFRSGINESIKADLHSIVLYALRQSDSHQGRWLDTGSNDGTLLSYVPSGQYHRTGIDPLKQFADECSTHADRVITEYFSPKHFEPGEFNVITSSAMFYDLEDPGKFADEIKQVLTPRGVWVIQQNYTLDMLRNNVVDNIIHEHVTYFSVASLKKLMEHHDLEVVDVTYCGAKGGCIRTAIAHKGSRQPSVSVEQALHRELPYRLDKLDTWTRWGVKTRLELAETYEELYAAKQRGWCTYLYGASTRASTFLQMLEISPDLVPFAVERDDRKIGKVMTATGIPIIGEANMRENPPDYLLIGPWFFRNLFVEREKKYLENGGRMIFPLPRFEVVSA